MIYPDTLPAPDQVNYSGVIDNGLLRSSVPSALAYQYPTFNSPTTVIDLVFSMDNATYVLWDAWIQENGWDWFEFPHTISRMIPVNISSTHRVRVIGDVGYQKRGHDWLSTTLQIELVPGDSQDPNITLGTYDWIIGQTPASPSTDWIIAGTPASPSEDWIRAELYYTGA